FRPILYLAALPAYLSLKFTGIFFHAFIFVDYFGRYLAKLRNNLVVKMNHWTTEAEQSSKHLRRNPLKVAACMPFATITAAIPIVGNGTFAHTASVIEDLSKSTLAQLRQIVRSIYAISYRTIRKPETSPADKKSAYIHLAIFTILGGMIAILSIFDLISDLINNIKTIALQYLNTRSFGIRRNFWGFLLNPLWLLILSPILIAVLLSPYFQLF
ncbi:MAG: hypothetical protein RIS47_2196, partial [Bacteroidota bacterium]